MFGGWRVLDGAMSMDALIKFFFLSNFFFSPIATIGNLEYNQALVAMAGAERVFRLIDTPPGLGGSRRRPWICLIRDRRRISTPDLKISNPGGSEDPVNRSPF